MKRHFFSISTALAALMFTFASCSSGGGGNEPDPGPLTVGVTGVTLNKTTTSLTVGGTETLTATVQPSNATNKNVTWSSSNTAIASVSNGTVTGVAAGTATITVTTQDGSRTATCTVTVTATTQPAPTTLYNYLIWLHENAQSNTQYTFTLRGNETIAGASLYYEDRSNVSLTLVGADEERTISFSNNLGQILVFGDTTLTLGNNVTLQGSNNKMSPLVWVSQGGTLAMNAGSKITGNTNTLASVGGVMVSIGGTFTMSGGTISGNTANGVSGPGGVYVVGGTFTMSGGTITGNTGKEGGGVSVGAEGTFIMNGGTISGNTVSNGSGGGVNVSSGTFIMNGGTISGNTASRNGGGMWSSGTSRIVNGTIYGSSETTEALRNTASSGAALYHFGSIWPNDTTEYGTFNGSTWVSNGWLDTTNNTIRVVNGVLQ